MIEDIKVDLKNSKHSLSVLNHYNIVNYNEQENLMIIEFEIDSNFNFNEIYKKSVDSKFGGTLSEFIKNDFKDLVRSDLMTSSSKRKIQITNFICDIGNSKKSINKFTVYINFIEGK